MAWTDACKIEACNQVQHKKESEGISARQAIRALSKESGIPQGTIHEWVYPRSGRKTHSREHLKNEHPLETCAISDLQTLVDSGKKFSTIYADPPWQYSNQATRSSTDNHYSTMTVDEISALPIQQLTEENAHLHLWTTNAFLFDSIKVIEAWGFEYKSCFVWVKPQMGIGNYWRVSHEFLLFGLKGKCPFLNRGQKSWMEIDRTKHSRKPEEIATTIMSVSPGPYVELFGRKTRDGWTVWGNEIERTLFNGSAFKNNLSNGQGRKAV